jgi:hypothetical protein
LVKLKSLISSMNSSILAGKFHCQNWQYQEIPLPKLAVPCGYY